MTLDVVGLLHIQDLINNETDFKMVLFEMVRSFH